MEKPGRKKGFKDSQATIDARKKGGNIERPRWDIIESEWYTGTFTLQGLADRHGIHVNTLRMRITKDRWEEKSRESRLAHVEELNKKIMEELYAERKEAIRTIQREHERMAVLLVRKATKDLERAEEEGFTYDVNSKDKIILGKLQSEVDATNKIIHTCKVAVELQRKILDLDEGNVTEQEQQQLIEFVESKPPKGFEFASSPKLEDEEVEGE